MIERKLSAPIDRVYSLLTNATWLEQRSLDLGELSATVRTEKTVKGASNSMQRRIKRDVPAFVAKILKPEADMALEESWTPAKGGYIGSLTLDLAGQPITITADFSLRGEGQGCIYSIQHKARCSVPLIGAAVEKFALGQVENGCSDELDYLEKHLQQNR